MGTELLGEKYCRLLGAQATANQGGQHSLDVGVTRYEPHSAEKVNSLIGN